jgi:hypothetical protein
MAFHSGVVGRNELRSHHSLEEVLAGLDTRLDTPPISFRHHPVSCIARALNQEPRAERGVKSATAIWALPLGQ